jgi:hypothetical protein
MITLKTLHKATTQQVFDQVATHLLKQKRRSEGKGSGLCAYKSENGRKCAAGCLISDAEYKPEFEGNNWREMISRHKVPAYHEELILTLQSLHDKVPPPEWCEGLRKIAKTYDLKATVTAGF